MAPKLSLEARMTIIELLRRGSWSRLAALRCSLRKDQLAWQGAYIAAFTRLVGVPA
jgi:hypothetical protein